MVALVVVSTLAGACETAPPPGPEAVAQRFVRLQELQDYAAMYALLTPSAKERIEERAFVQRYGRIAEEMTLQQLRISLVPASSADAAASPKTDRAIATVRAEFRTTLVGTFVRDIALELARQRDGTWLVDWTPASIIPELTGERLIRLTRLVPPRGRILARDSTELATAAEGVLVGVVRDHIRNEAALLRLLSPLVDLPEEDVRRRYAPGERDWFMPIRVLPPDTPTAVRERLRLLEGVQLRAVTVRVYPQRTLAAHLVGYVGPITPKQLDRLEPRGYHAADVVGRAGLEAALEEVLAGTFGWRLGVVEPDGTPAAALAERPPLRGLDVVLAIDPVAQRAAESAIASEQRGSVVLEDVTSGEITALASHPTFDPNAFAFDDHATIAAYLRDVRSPLLPRATLGQYPTGSAFKPITAAAALGAGVLRPGELVPCPAVFYGYGVPQRNHETADLGRIDLDTAMARSCNTFFYELGKRLNDRDPRLLPSIAMSFGLGQPTEIESVIEASGVVPSPDWRRTTFADPLDQEWRNGDATNLAIGQGDLLVTPLQMANYTCAVLNGGTLWRPRVVLRYQRADGSVVKEFSAEVRRKVGIGPEHLVAVRQAMRGVVADLQGTAYAPFRGFSVAVVGKSGTAETTSGAPNAWFIGGGPVNAPTTAVAALVEEKPGILGSQDAATIGRKALAAALRAPQ